MCKHRNDSSHSSTSTSNYPPQSQNNDPSNSLVTPIDISIRKYSIPPRWLYDPLMRKAGGQQIKEDLLAKRRSDLAPWNGHPFFTNGLLGSTGGRKRIKEDIIHIFSSFYKRPLHPTSTLPWKRDEQRRRNCRPRNASADDKFASIKMSRPEKYALRSSVGKKGRPEKETGFFLKSGREIS